MAQREQVLAVTAAKRLVLLGLSLVVRNAGAAVQAA